MLSIVPSFLEASDQFLYLDCTAFILQIFYPLLPAKYSILHTLSNIACTTSSHYQLSTRSTVSQFSFSGVFQGSEYKGTDSTKYCI